MAYKTDGKSKKIEYDRVDEAALETFPSSDPPAWTLGKESRKKKIKKTEEDNAYEMLLTEVRILMKKIKIFEEIAVQIEQNDEQHLGERLDNLINEVQKLIHECHQQKINLLFSAFKNNKEPSAYLMNDLKREEQLGKKLLSQLKKMNQLEMKNKSQLIHLLKQQKNLYLTHLEKECEYLLPHINNNLTVVERIKLFKQFKKIEQDFIKHEKNSISIK